MTIHVQIFASLAHRLGTEQLSFDLPAGATTATLLDALVERHPAAAEFRNTLAVAVNRAYVQSDHVLSESDEVALIPPVSGG